MNYTLLADICNLWRNYDDIQDSWRSVLSILDWFVTHQDILQPVAGPGHWNDPDMVPAWRGMAQGPLPCAVFLDTHCQVLDQHLRNVSLNQPCWTCLGGLQFCSQGPTPPLGSECSERAWECPLLTVFPGSSDVS